MKILVEGEPSTTFQMGEQVTISDGDFNLELIFEGKGRLTGHIHRGNRPGQLLAKGESRFDAHDWHLFLRGDEPETAMVTMRIKGG